MGSMGSLETSGDGLQRPVNIPLDEFSKIVDSGSSLVLDVRQPYEVGAVRVDAKHYVNIPLNKLDNALKMDREAFERTYKCPKPDVDDDVAFICRSGSRSLSGIQIARANHYVNARHFAGGTSGWSREFPNRVVSGSGRK